MRAGSVLMAGLLVSCAAPAASAATATAFDPVAVDLADVMACKIDGRHYLGFVLTISDEDSPGSAKARGWVKLPSRSLFFSSYRLPKPVSAFGYTTSTVAFTGSAMLAVLDIPDASALGVAQGVTNLLEGSGQFKGERMVDESTSIDPESGYGFKNRSALQIATSAAFPGKTLIGCSYRGEIRLPES